MKQQACVCANVQRYVTAASLFPNSARLFKTNIDDAQKCMFCVAVRR